MFVLATSGEGADATLTARDLQDRSFLSGLKNIGNTIAKGITSVAGNVATAVTSAAGTVATAVNSGAQTLQHGELERLAAITVKLTEGYLFAASVNENQSGSTPFSFSKSHSLAAQSVRCAGNQYNPSFTATYDVGVQATGSGTVSYSVAIVGTMSPPAFSQFSLDVGLNADISSSLSLNALGGVSNIACYRSCRPSSSFFALLVVSEHRLGRDI